MFKHEKDFDDIDLKKYKKQLVIPKSI